MSDLNLKNKDGLALKKLSREKREALRQFRFDIAGSRIKNVKTGRDLKRDIARILTETKARKNQENE